ncbi:hypothetical protein GCM10027176_07630 [Actinoallomurus bryophytorum]|uniref:Uncharacterized protein n=1 Tax=Actinoallomurus bryophytorum TaxID=1490222 RepID=A0A543CTG3_9ACTN|nr:hypothetical protein [Actinoallomurus bryophytorum]TQM00384.1 hypothetical protein FB559_6096 [Actinoallomurus bryophytorum]
MRFRHGILLMVTAAALVVVVVAGVTMALLGGGGGRSPHAGGPPAEDSAATASASASPSGPSLAPRGKPRKPKTSASTMVGVPPSAPAAPRPVGSVKPSQLPSWWPSGDPRFRHWHRNSPPPWWHHH